MKRSLLYTALLVLVFTVFFSACADATDVRPLDINPEEIDLNNGTFCLNVRNEERISEDGFFTAELYLEDRYDAEQVKALAPGDTVEMNGAIWTVDEIIIHQDEYPEEQAVYEIVPVEEYYGYMVFSPTADGTCIAVIDDWVPVTPVGEIRVSMPLPERFTYVRISSGEEKDPVGADVFLEDLDMFGGFNPYNSTCVMEDGALVNVLHSSYPWGPEEYWPGEEDALPDDSDDSADSGASASEEIPVWQFCHAGSPDKLETAVITGYKTDCEEGPIPYEMTDEEKGEIRALAMYGVVTGKQSDEMVTGGTWVYSFETTDGEYIMSIEMYKGMQVGRDGMYSCSVSRNGDV